MTFWGKRRNRVVTIVSAAALVVVPLLVVPGSPVKSAVRLAANADCYRFGEEGGVAAIGDSITIGTSLAGWPAMAKDSWLSRAVCANGVPFTYNGGVHNQTTQQIAARLDDVLSHKPKALAFLIGTNDVYQEDFGPASIQRVRDMVSKTEAAGVRPVLATLPPIKDKAAEVEKFNGIIKDIARQENLPVIDFHAVLTEGDHYKGGLTKDGLHPNEKGAVIMGDVAAPVLAAALR